jgi:hypothetical protein
MSLIDRIKSVYNNKMQIEIRKLLGPTLFKRRAQNVVVSKV